MHNTAGGKCSVEFPIVNLKIMTTLCQQQPLAKAEMIYFQCFTSQEDDADVQRASCAFYFSIK